MRSWRARTLMVIAVIVPLVAISAAEYVIWTPPGLATVYGVQPRYWLPVLPAMMLLVTGWRAPGSDEHAMATPAADDCSHRAGVCCVYAAVDGGQGLLPCGID